MIEAQTTSVPLDQIQIGERQRSSLSPEAVEALADSIHKRGLIHPILVERDTNLLIAGENRLAAFHLLRERHGDQYAEILVRFGTDISHQDRVALELEENIRRSDLPWQDAARSITAYHRILCEIHGEEWRLEDTGNMIAMSPSTISRYITVATALADGNELATKATGLVAAYNALRRASERAMNREINQFILAGNESAAVSPPSDSLEDGWNAGSSSDEYPLYQADFNIWAQNYTGPKFNFIHCDFPYGIGWDTAKKGGSSSFTRSEDQAYSDSLDVYETLIRTLITHADRLCDEECHIMFWLSARFDYHERTRQMLLDGFPGARIDPCALIWHRSDSSGVLVDPARGGRRTYETAIQITLGDRKIVRAVDLSFAAPSGRAERHHISQKPDAVLRHFFRMYVDEDTYMLDPTCGFGGALRAAESLKAKHIVGLELNPEIAEEARQECLTYRMFNRIGE